MVQDVTLKAATSVLKTTTAALIVAAGVGAADAQTILPHEIKLGVLAHDVPDLWSGFSVETNAVDLNLEVLLSPSLPFRMSHLRPALGLSINTDGGTSHAYADIRWQLELPHGLFLATGIGVAVHNGELRPTNPDMKALGSRALFHIPFEAGVRLDNQNSLSIYFEHTSNAGMARYNEGMDRLGIRYGRRF